MNTTKSLKALLSESYQTESDLNQIIEECFKEIFKHNSTYICSLFEEDLQSGRECNGCLQGLEYYKNAVERDLKRLNEFKKIKEDEKKDEC